MGQFTIHYTQDKRENATGRGCMHEGGSDTEYLEDKDSCVPIAMRSFTWAVNVATSGRSGQLLQRGTTANHSRVATS